MIDSKELRIGNLAESPIGWIGSVIELKSSFVRLYKKDDLSAYNFGSDLIDPIPITPEWLERLGFEKLPPKNHWEEYWEKGILRLYITDGKISPIAVINSERPKYVHQLQNLYYALTGQELTINK